MQSFYIVEFPEMKAISKGRLSYLTRRFERDAVTKPMLGLEESTIHVTKVTNFHCLLFFIITLNFSTPAIDCLSCFWQNLSEVWVLNALQLYCIWPF